MAIPIALVDLAWVLYKFRFYHKTMCRYDSSGRYLPTGHVYGTINIIQQLAKSYKAVILCVDSPVPHRFEALPEYKSGRHSPTGDPYEDYNIKTDLLNVLKLCTYPKNVFYIKYEGMESDDIIASWIATAGDNWDLHCYFNDNDILQTKGTYHWYNSFNDPEVDRKTYIYEKYGVSLDYLPLWYKVIRGDSSDRIPVGIPRFPTKKLVTLCEEADKDCFTLCWLYEKAGLMCKGLVEDREEIEAISRNMRVVSPIIKDISDFKLKRLGMSFGEGQELLSYYGISDFVLEG